MIADQHAAVIVLEAHAPLVTPRGFITTSGEVFFGAAKSAGGDVMIKFRSQPKVPPSEDGWCSWITSFLRKNGMCGFLFSFGGLVGRPKLSWEAPALHAGGQLGSIPPRKLHWIEDSSIVH